MPPEADPATLDPFALGRPPTPLARRLAASIMETGPITFAEFMGRALYEPGLGYYRSGRPTVGRDGDYLTSPELHPLFGSAVAMAAASVWEQLGRPASFDFVEVGPGTGALVESAWRWMRERRPELAAAVRFRLVEESEPARAQQRARLEGVAAGLEWASGVGALSRVSGMIVANELLDAQPVHRLRWDGARWRELYVAFEGKGLVTAEGEPRRPELLERLAGVRAEAGQEVELAFGVGALVGGLAGSLERGALLLFDYGYPRAELYAARRRTGTLMTFRRHTPGEQPLEHVGEQDLTCHVDLDLVREAAESAGLRALGFRAQGEWLLALGAGGPPPSGGGPALDEHLSRRRALQLLSDPGGLGRVQVMGLLAAGVESLPGLTAEAAS